MRRRLLPTILAAPLVLALAGTASAYIESTVSVFNEDGTPAGDTVCEFYMEFNPTPGGEEGSWELWSADETVVAQGPYMVTDTEGDREPDTGVLSLADGTYLLVWDDETPVDLSRREHEIVVDCEEASPSEAPTESAPPSEAPTGSVLPTESVAVTPSGGVEGATGTPGVTPPPTDVSSASSTAGTTVSGILVSIIALAGAVIFTTRRFARR